MSFTDSLGHQWHLDFVTCLRHYLVCCLCPWFCSPTLCPFGSSFFYPKTKSSIETPVVSHPQWKTWKSSILNVDHWIQCVWRHCYSSSWGIGRAVSAWASFSLQMLVVDMELCEETHLKIAFHAMFVHFLILLWFFKLLLDFKMYP